MLFLFSLVPSSPQELAVCQAPAPQGFAYVICFISLQTKIFIVALRELGTRG